MAAVSSVAEVNCHGRSLVHLSSFNMHGFNQGITTVDELISDFGADVVCVQEHWLTPDNLCNLNKWSEFMVFSILLPCLHESSRVRCLGDHSVV
jgi:hypothetical protein